MSNSAISFNTAGLASTTSPGLVGTGAQTFAGAKTFQDGLIPPQSMMFRNKLINGGFDIWQYGTTQTATRFYGSDDRWNNDYVGSSRTHSQQTFTLGQTDVPGNPRFFSRTVASSVAGAGNYVAKYQKIEGVRTFAGQTVTLSFWAKADAARNIATSVDQFFGTGGSPSSGVVGNAPATYALTTSWKYFTSTFTVPSIAGKTIGTNNNDCLTLLFWFDAGSTFNSQTNSLGQQSGTFDIANVQLEAGPVATPFEQRPIGTELALCQRYYEHVNKSYMLQAFAFISRGASDNRFDVFVPLKVTKRISSDAGVLTTNSPLSIVSNYTPTGTQFTIYYPGADGLFTVTPSGWTVAGNMTSNILHIRAVNSSTSAINGTIQIAQVNLGADAFFGCSAEL